MAHYAIVIPTNNVANAFSEKIAPLIQKIIVNILQTRRLAEIRDSLLPKLMSGKIRVPIEVSP
jgi:type I restriction enzyme S subunit